MQLYFDCSNCSVTNNDTGVPIFKGNDGIWIESWWVSKEENTVIDFVYSQTMRDMKVVNLEREAHFNRYNVNPRFLRNMVIPKSVYEQEEMKFDH